MASHSNAAMPTIPESSWAMDINILVHATAIDAPAEKQRIAQRLLEQLFLSPLGWKAAQVLSEYLSVVLRRKVMAPASALKTVTIWSQAARMLDAAAKTYGQALRLAAKHKYQVWDALIISVCAAHGVKTLLPENVGSLKRPLGIHVVNPFAPLKAP